MAGGQVTPATAEAKPPDPDNKDAALQDAPVVRRFCGVAAMAITLIAIVWTGWPVFFGEINLYAEQMVAVVLGLSLAVIFLRRPAWGKGPRPYAPVYDIVLALLALGAAGWLAVRFQVLSEDAFYHPTETIVLAGLLVVLVAEGLRRAAGYSLLIVLLLFIAYALLGHMIGGEMQARPSTVPELIRYAGLDTTAMLGRPLLIVTTIVIVFVFLGHLLLLSGGSDFFIGLSSAMVGRYRGGSAKIAVTASAMFGSISGSAVSNVASTGILTIPMMTRAGYPRTAAGAIEAVASTGGQLTPPIMGAAAFLMVEYVPRATYQDVILAALVPAALFYLAVFINTDLEAGKRDIRPVDSADVPRARSVLREGWFLLAPFAVLVFILFYFNEEAALAALGACAVLIVVASIFSYAGKRLSPRSIVAALRNTGFTVVDILAITAVAGMIIGILQRSSLDFSLGFVLIQLGEQSLALLLILTALVCMILGMGMPTTGVYLLLATLAAPPLIKLGVEPMAAHMFVLYFGMLSMITPPVAIAAFTAASLSGASPMATAVAAVRFGWPAYVVPFLFVLSPTLLLHGEPVAVTIAIVTAVAGVWAATVGIAGYLRDTLAAWQRVAMAFGGLALLIPPRALPGAIWINVAGAVIVGATLAILWRTGSPGSARR